MTDRRTRRDLVAQMAGRFRLPDALKRVDRLARGLELPRPAV